jgi:hypothetical protein
MARLFSSLVLLTFILGLLDIVEAKFRPDLVWTSRPKWESYEHFQIAHNYIKIAWKQAQNSGFQYRGTDIEFCKRDDVRCPLSLLIDFFKDAVYNSKLTLYPMMFNSTYYYQLYTDDKYWICKIVTFMSDASYRVKTTHLFKNLDASNHFNSLNYIGKAYRFRVKQKSALAEVNDSDWSDYKILATNMEPEHLKNEYVEFYARGSGARNHNTTVFKIDNYTLLDTGVIRGLYLIVLSRKNLAIVHQEVFDTMKAEESFPLNIITSEQTPENNNTCFNVTTNLTTGESKFANGTVFVVPPESTVETLGGSVTYLVRITTFGNITQTCNLILYRYNTRNYTQYTVNEDLSITTENKKFITY